MSNDISLKSESTKSISESYSKSTKSISESISKSSKPTSNSNQITESYSKPSSSTISEDHGVGAGGQLLGQIMIEQINQNEALDHNLKVIDQIQSNRFLDEMRNIQETGKKAAELMLKASRNIARQVSLLFRFYHF